MKTTLLYIRVSTDKQFEEGYSVAAQEKKLIDYCVSNKITKYEVLIEGGFTGKNTHRPKYEYAVNLINQDKVDRIIMFKLDRMFRNVRDTLAFIEDIAMPHNVSMVSLNENLDTSTPSGRFMITVYAGVAQMELSTMRLRMDAGALERAKSGLWRGGGNVNFGYSYDKDKGMLVPNEKAEIVKQVFRLYVDGHSTMEIARLFNFKYPDHIAKMLKRPIYAGYIVWNGEVYKGQHEPLVSEELFMEAQEVIKSKRWNSIGKHYYLLQNISHCGCCGAKLYYFPNSRKNRVYLRCYSSNNQQKYMQRSCDCAFGSKRVVPIENEIIKELFTLSLKHKTTELQDDSVNTEEILQKQKASLSQKLSRLYDLYAESGNEVLKKNIDTLIKEIESIENQIAKAIATGQQSKQSQKTKEVIDSIETAWPHATQQEKQQMIRILISKVVIDNEFVTVHWDKLLESEPFSFPVPPKLGRNSIATQLILFKEYGESIRKSITTERICPKCGDEEQQKHFDMNKQGTERLRCGKCKYKYTLVSEPCVNVS